MINRYFMLTDAKLRIRAMELAIELHCETGIGKADVIATDAKRILQFLRTGE